MTENSENSISPFAISDTWGSIYLFWADSTSGNFDIYFKRLIPGSGWGSDTNLTQNSTGSENPTVSIDSLNNLYLYYNESGEIFRKIRDHQLGWFNRENISNTSTGSNYPSSSFYCDVVWTEGDSSPYNIRYYRNIISDTTPPQFSITAPETVYLYDTLNITFTVDEELSGLPTGWLKDINQDSIPLVITETAPLSYEGRVYVSGLSVGQGHIIVWGSDLHNNLGLADSTIHIDSLDTTPPQFAFSLLDTVFIGDSLSFALSVNEPLATDPNIWLIDSLNDSLKFVVNNDSNFFYSANLRISGFVKGPAHLRIMGADRANNITDTTTDVYIDKRGDLLPKDSCFAFPNPTRKNYIKFIFYLNQNAHFKIEIFTLSGRKICTFIDKDYEGGRLYEETMSVQNMGSDIYIFRATATAANEKATIMKKFGVIR